MEDGVEISATQRFLRRIFIKKNFPLILRESAYHKAHHTDENRDGVIIWRWDEEEGQNVNPL